MNKADIIAIIIISLFIGLGIYVGFLRSITTAVASIFALQIAEKAHINSENAFIITFLGITSFGALIGGLVYGATRFQPIESMEGVFGAILGLIVGWQIARFVFSFYFIFRPESSFLQIIQSSSMCMDVYNVTPVQNILHRLDGLMHPHVDQI